MTNSDPYHVRLAISQYGDQFRAELFTEDLGDTDGDVLPGRWEVLEQYVPFLKQGAASLPPDAARQVGQELFEYLLGHAENSKKWTEILDQAQRQGRTIRLLIDATTETVRDLPYGLLCEPHDNYYLLRPGGDRQPIQVVRVVRRCTPHLLNLSRQPLRLLIAAAEPASPDIPGFGCAQRMCQLAQRLCQLAQDGRAAYEVFVCGADGAQPVRDVLPGSVDTWQPEQFVPFCRTTRDVLQAALPASECEILHLMAHGVGAGVLLCDATGGPDEVTASELGTWCHASQAQMAFLQVCKASQTADRGGFGGLAQQLLNPKCGDLAAVVASPYPVDAEKSTPAAINFYQGLAREQSPDLALDRNLPETNWAWAFLELWVRPRALGGTGTRGAFQFPSPYQGLARFEERDAEIFFGREAETAELLNILATEPIVAVVGDSGSGKSSLLQAGVIATVRQQGLLNRTDWRIGSLKPGPAPVSSLLIALTADAQGTSAVPPETWRATLQTAFTHVLQAAGAALIVLDQCEELFTLCQDDAQRRVVGEVMGDLAQRYPERFRLLIGIRSEFLGMAVALPGMGVSIKRPWVLTPPNPEKVRDIVAKPAEYYGYTFEAGLLDWILTDPLLTAAAPAARSMAAPTATTATPLPLLEFALERLWLKAVERGAHEFTHADYDKLGGLGGAIAKHAEEMYVNLPDLPELGVAAQRVTEQIFTGLVSAKGTRLPRSRRELEAETGNPALARKVIDHLVGERLLTLRRNPTTPDDAQVDLTHEVLITRWERLQAWLAQDPEGRAMKEAFVRATDVWAQGRAKLPARSPKLLPNVEEARGYLAWIEKSHPTLTELQQAFNQELRQLDRREKRRGRIVVGTISTFLVIAVIAAVFGWIYQQKAEQKKNEAELAQAETVVRQKEAVKQRNKAIQAEKATRRQLSLNYFSNGVTARDLFKDWVKASQYFMKTAAFTDDPALARNGRLAGNELVKSIWSNVLLHKAAVKGAVFSRDDSRVLTWSDDGTARVWESTTGQPLTPSLEHKGPVKGAVFNRDESRILTWSEDGTARVWDVSTVLNTGGATAQPLVPLLEHKGPVKGAVFNRDESRILTWSADGTARVWDSRTGQPLTPPLEDKSYIYGAVFSRDETRIMTWGGSAARVWDSKTGQPLTPPLTPPLEHKSDVYGAVFSRDETRILTWCWGAAQLWDSATGQPLTPPLEQEHEDLVNGAAFSQDESRVLTWSGTPPIGTGRVRVWDSLTGQPLTPPFAYAIWTHGVFNREATRVLTWSSAPGTAQVWDSATGQPLTPSLENAGGGAVFSRDETRILTWGQNTYQPWDRNTYQTKGVARVWDSATGQPLTPPLEHQGTVYGSVFSRDETRILTWGGSAARVWDSLTGQPLTPPLAHKDTVNGAVFTQDETRILTWSKDGTARVWDVSTALNTGGVANQSLTPPLKHKDFLNGAVFSQDETRILTWSGEYGKSGAARVWDSATGQPLTPPLEHKDAVNSAVFSRDETRILTWSNDGTVRAWDSLTGRPLTPPLENADDSAVFATGQTLPPSLEHKGPFKGVVSNRDETRILTWSKDDTARVWDSATGQPLTPPLEHKNAVNGAAFSRDETRILTWSADGMARVWDSATGQPLTPPLEHKNAVNGAAFSRDETRILTWSKDDTARVWDSATGQPLTPPLENGLAYAGGGAVFSQDETRILTWGGDAARVWELQTDDDFPPEHLSLQLAVQTNTWMNDLGDLAVLSAEEWQTQHDQYAAIAREHLKTCNFPQANLWLKRLLDQPDSCDRIGDWLSTVNPAVADKVALRYARACLSRGDFWCQKQEYERATRAFETALQLQTLRLPESLKVDSSLLAETYAKLGRPLIASGQNVAQGIEYAQKSLELNPHQFPDFALRTLAMGYRQQGEHQKAAAAYVNLAQAYVRWHEYALALEAYQQAMELDPEIKAKIVIELEHTKIRAYAQQGKYPEALDAYHQTIERYPEIKAQLDVTAYKAVLDNVVQGYKQEQKYAEIEREYACAIQSGLGDAQTHGAWLTALAQTLVQEEKFKDALAAYAKARKLDPTLEISAEDWNTLCRNGSLSGAAAEVLEACEQAVKLQPENGYFHDSYGLARFLTGNITGAIENFQVFVDGSYDAKQKAQRQQWIESLRKGENPFTPAVLEQLRK